MTYETIVRNGRAVLPRRGVTPADIGIRGGRIVALGEALGDADEVIDAEGRLVLPGAVNAHDYQGLAQAADSDTLGSLAGGVTTVISYLSTDSDYLAKPGNDDQVFPETLEAVAGHARTDYALRLAPMTFGDVLAAESLEPDSAAGPANVLHLTSAEALEAAVQLRRSQPKLSVRLETALHHLADCDALWEALTVGEIDWVVSDHRAVALHYPYLLTEGHRRGLRLERTVDLIAHHPARAYGLAPRKGEIAVGADADLVIVDTQTVRTVTPGLVRFEQEHAPFEGMELTGWPVLTMLRGNVVYRDNSAVGSPFGTDLGSELRDPETVGAR